MGLDVNLYADGDFTDEEFAAADALLLARSTLPDREYNDDHALTLEQGDNEIPRRASVYTLARYYGQGYERGDWPTIYGAVRLLQAAMPRATVYYGWGGTDFGQECDEEFLAEMWAHFVGPHGDDYRVERATWMAKLNGSTA